MDLNSVQTRLVELPVGHDLVIAPPGTGKTTLLTHRIKHLVDSGHMNLDECMLFSYTNKQSEELILRTCKMMGLPEPKNMKELPMVGGTMHGFCFKEVKDYVGNERSRVLSNKPEMQMFEMDIIGRIVEGEFNDLVDDDRPRFMEIMDEYHKMIGKQKGMLGSMVRVVESEMGSLLRQAESYTWKNREERHHWSHNWRSFINEWDDRDREIICDGLLSIMVDEGTFTFGSMILVYYKLATGYDTADYITNRLSNIKYFMVDEFQDAGGAQGDVIRRLSEIVPGCMLTGDPMQTIYNNGMTESLGRMIHDKRFQVHALNEGHRCSHFVTEKSNLLRAEIARKFTNTDEEFNRIHVDLKPAEDITEQGSITITRFRGKHVIKQAFAHVLDETSQLISSDESVCYMLRTNQQVQSLSSMIKSRGSNTSIRHTNMRYSSNYHLMSAVAIYYYMRRFLEGNSLMMVDNIVTSFQEQAERIGRNVIIRSNATVGMSVAEMRRRTMIFRVFDRLLKPFISFIVRARKSDVQVSDTIRNRLLNNEEFRHQDVINYFRFDTEEDRDRMVSLITGPRNGEYRNSVKGIIERIHNLAERARMDGEPRNVDELSTVLSRRFADIRKSESSDKIIEGVRGLTLRYFLNIHNSEEFLRTGIIDRDEKNHREASIKETVSVSQERSVVVTDTLHSRKGLEYDNIVIIVPEEQTVVSSQGGHNLDSELCLEYVGLTRAKKNVHIYLWGDNPDKPRVVRHHSYGSLVDNLQKAHENGEPQRVRDVYIGD